MTLLGSTERIPGELYDYGGTFINPRHPNWEVNADGLNDDYAQLALILDLARTNKVPIMWGDYYYLHTAPLNFADTHSIGSPTFLPSGFVSEAIYGEGDVGDYLDLDQNATRRTNFIVCAALAAIVEIGDKVRITSDTDFSAAEPNIKQAESARVRNIVGSTIYFDTPLMDTYLVAEGARAAVIGDVKVLVQGKITVIHSNADNTTATRGIRFKFATVTGHFELSGCHGTSASFNNDWADDVTVDTYDATRPGSGVTAYGISLQNAVMYGRYRGNIHGARHAVSGSGSGHDGESGPGWENVVTVDATGGYPASILDTHDNVGSIYFIDCIIRGGDLYDLDGAALSSRPGGISCGARRTYIHGLRAYDVNSVIYTRSNAGADQELIEISDVKAYGVAGQGFSKSVDSPLLHRLSIDNFHVEFTGDEDSSLLNFVKGDVSNWNFNNVHARDGRLFSIGNGATGVPNKLKITNFSCILSTEAADTEWRGVRNNDSNIEEIVLKNGEFENLYYPVEVESDLNRLELVNVNSNIAKQHILIGGVYNVGFMKLIGCSFKGSTHGSVAQGVVSVTAGGTITDFMADDLDIDTDVYLVGSGSVVTRSFIGICKTHAGFLGFIRSPAASYLEVLSGSFEQPRLIRGSGDPNGVVTGPISCIYERRDSSNVYRNTDGATTWVAL